MYKNVLNHLLVGSFLLFPSCFLAIAAKAQTINPNPLITHAFAGTKTADQSNQSSLAITNTTKTAGAHRCLIEPNSSGVPIAFQLTNSNQ